jgi:antagonist of KipI
VYVPRGEIFGLRSQNAGGWGYLAVHGGIDVPVVLGSRSTYLRIGLGGLEGRMLRFGDHLCAAVGGQISSLSEKAGRSLMRDLVPKYSDAITVDLIPAPQFDVLTVEQGSGLLATSYTISEQSDRMGYRLKGQGRNIPGVGDILSEGAVPGTVQLPADGQPMVLLVDAQTTGGYAKPGVIPAADLGRFVQCPIGSGEVRFSVTTVTLAQQRWRKMLQELKSDTGGEENS